MKTKNIFYLFLVVVAFFFIYKNCDNGSKKSNKRTKSVTSNEWYVGGTLHKSNIADWHNASESNKLATCADFMSTVDNSVSMTELKRRSEDLKICIEKATQGVENIDDLKLSDVAANCIILLGY